MSEQAFETMADRLLEHLEEAIGAHVDAERQGGVLTVQAGAGTWVVNKHASTRQIWLSSPKSGAHHYGFEADLLATLAAELDVALEWTPE